MPISAGTAYKIADAYKEIARIERCIEIENDARRSDLEHFTRPFILCFGRAPFREQPIPWDVVREMLEKRVESLQSEIDRLSDWASAEAQGRVVQVEGTVE